MSGSRDLAVSTWPRRHGDRKGWQWALVTSYATCIATGWVPGTRADARRAAKPAKAAYLAKMGRKGVQA